MKNKDRKASAPTKERQVLSPEALARAIDAQRQRLKEVWAIVHSNANLLHESYHFEIDEADLGYCCDVVRDMLGRVITTLEPLSVAPGPDSTPADPMALAHAIEAPRQQLFRAQAVAQAVVNLMRDHEFGDHESDLRVVLSAVVDMLERVIADLEPLHLGLPIPR